MFGRGLVAGVEEVSTTAKIYSLAALSATYNWTP
jgi:hypothetical protein